MPSQKIITRAIEAAFESKLRYKVAAILYKGGSVIRIKCNSLDTIQYRKKYFHHNTPTKHAEMNVIHSMPRDVIKECSLLVVRLNKEKQLLSAKPCKACAKMLLDSGIKKVYYSSYDESIKKLDLQEIQGNYKKEIPNK